MRSLREIFADDPMSRLVSPSSDAERGMDLNEAPPPAEDAQLVESGPFEALDLQCEPTVGFTHFLDGAQRSWRAMYHGMLPVTLAHTSAALLRRVDRSVEAPTEGSYLGCLEAFVPAERSIVNRLRGEIACIEIPITEDDTGLGVAFRTRQAVENRRKSHELNLCASYHNGCLLVDGGLGEALERLDDDADVVGLVKSHQRQYFRSRDRQLVILNLKPGQRTTAFLRESTVRQGKACYSFYLKLREQPGQGPLFGLGRVEVPATERNLRRLDEVASWVLAERAPLSLPDPRFQVLLYPIHLVEEHLKARQPSEAAIRGLIGV